MASSCAGHAIAALLPLVDAFNHRHRNQHRASPWWAPFSILRRALRALADGLLPLSTGPEPSPSARRRRRRHAAARARWLTSHVVPRVYVAFTQLAADNQHAPLGLMLLAVLGRAYAALADLAPPDAPDAQLSPPPRQPSAKARPRPQPPAEPPGPDRGVVVSRRDVLAAHGPLASTSSKHSRRGDKDNKRQRKKSARNETDALSSLFSSLD